MFSPLNRHLLLEEVEEIPVEKEESLVLVPDDYSIKKSPHDIYKILKLAPDCEKLKEEHVNCKIVVDESMVQKITIGEERYYLVLENYVYGTF
jgi:hypothetical protein